MQNYYNRRVRARLLAQPGAPSTQHAPETSLAFLDEPTRSLMGVARSNSSNHMRSSECAHMMVPAPMHTPSTVVARRSASYTQRGCCRM